MNTSINDLLKRMEWPSVNAVTYGDGRMTLMELEFYGDGRHHVGPIADTTLESYLFYNSDGLASFDITASTHHGDHTIHVGDGSGESDGVVFVIEQATQRLVWFAFFVSSGPFVSVRADDGQVQAVTSAGVRWSLAVSDPLDIHLSH